MDDVVDGRADAAGLRTVRRALAVVVAVALLAVVGQRAEAAGSDITIVARVSVPTLRVKWSTTVVGTVTPPTALRSVVLQRFVDGAWRDRGTAQVGSDGRFAIRITPTQVSRYQMRMVSPGRTVVSNQFFLDVVPPPTITARVGASATRIGSLFAITGEVKPAGATSRVVSQRYVNGRWEDREAAVPDRYGRFSITIRPSGVARYQMRVRSSGGTVASNSVRFHTYTGQVNTIYDLGLYRGEKVVTLTFDDGPSTTYTPQVLDLLAKHKVKATFFVVGRSVATWPETTKRIVREGHYLANHSWDHPEFTAISDAGIKSQVQRTQDQIAKVGGSSICVRPPYGAQNSRVRNVLASMRFSNILWNTDPGDWRGYSASTIVSRVMSQVKPGSILLFHDGGANRGNMVQALAQIIPALKSRGYRFVQIC